MTTSNDSIPWRGGAEIAGRLGVARGGRALLIDAPTALASAIEAASAEAPLAVADQDLRAVKELFATVFLWHESRVGSRAAIDAARKRLEPGGRLWIGTALKKVRGPRTPAVHRLERGDLEKAIGRKSDAEVRLSAWHVAYGFRV